MSSESLKPQPITFSRIISGISDYNKETTQTDAIAFGRFVDFRTDPKRWTINPKTIKESGSVITALPVAGDRIGDDSYIYDDVGNIYKRTSAGVTTLQKSVPNSHGNGMCYFGEDGFLYYMGDKVIGRYGRIGSDPVFVDDFLGAQGGVPLNTHSLDLELSSSQYATAADSASLSITGDLALEINFKPESLPTVGNEMVLISKWNENGNKRSYKMGVYAVSGYFGDGSDGSYTVSSNTTDAPIDSACSGTSGANTLSATNASFTSGQIVLIIQMQGTGAGTYQRNKIVSYSAGTMVLENNLNFSYSSSSGNTAQVLVLKQYTNVTIDSGKTLTVKAWNGTVGGILGFIANGSGAITGFINGNGKGFRGATNGTRRTNTTGQSAYCGEGTGGVTKAQRTSNGNGGGGGYQAGGNDYNLTHCGGAGAGNANDGQNGRNNYQSYSLVPIGGSISGNNDLTTMTLGGGGGEGLGGGDNPGDAGGDGGAIIYLTIADLTITGGIYSNGTNAVYRNGGNQDGNAGGGSGGSINLFFQTASLGTGLITANAGTSSNSYHGTVAPGGDGSVGRIHASYYTSYTGSTTPTINIEQDNNLVTNTTYQLKVQLSTDGTAEETLTKSLNSITIDKWSHLAISWDASDHQVEFFEDGNSLGTMTGSITSLNNNDSLFAIGASFNSGAGAAENFADGKVDDIRVWGAERTASQIASNKEVELAGTETGLKGYWQVDNAVSDQTTNANNLTLVNTPSYSTDVPFAAATTRQDIDQEDTSTGSTYTLQTVITETASHRQTFVPAKDPQKSIGVWVDTVGTGDWTITVHDPQNRLIASKTILVANIVVGFNEFTFDDEWRPVVGASYHFHVTVSTGTSKIVAGSLDNCETAEFKSYYQFLVDDIYHPSMHTGNLVSIGNERYVAIYDASSYNPHRLTFPSGWRVRCIARWGEYYAYGCWRGNSVDDFDQGMIFFWDGYSTTYNFFIDVPEGAVNAMLGSQGTLYIVAGYQGDILEYTGGTKAKKVKRIPKITNDKNIEILPGALSMWRTLLQVGVGVTDSEEVEQGVYSYGKRNESYLDSLSYDYKISTGTTTSSGVKIGLIMPVKRKLLIGWKDNVTYGLDYVDPSNAPYPEASLEWLIKDEGGIWKEKKFDTLRADFEPLNSGESVSLQYKLDRNEVWSDVDSEKTEDSERETKLRIQPINTRHKEYQIRLNMMTTVSTSPAVLGVMLLEDTMVDEEFI